MPNKIIRIPGGFEGHDQDVSLFQKVIDSKLFQLKREIKQLDFVYKSYPGATHTRFEHCIGTMNKAEVIIREIKKNNPEFSLTKSDELTIELGALLHDIGHPPFSHATEQILSMYGEPDHNAKAIEYITKPVIRNGKEYNLGEVIKNIPGINYDLLIDLFKNQKQPKAEIIWSIIGADKLDYINRDARACGVEFESDVDRIMTYAYCDDNKYGAETKADISVAQHLTNWVSMHFEVYLRKTSNIIKGLFRRGLYELINNNGVKPKDLWLMTEGELLSVLNTDGTRIIYDRLLERELPKTFLSIKNTNKKNYEDVREKDIKVHEMSDERLTRLVSRFEDVNQIISLERGIEDLLGYDKFDITISELPHIKRLAAKNANLYDRDKKEWTTILDRMPEKKEEFESGAARKYVLRICTTEQLRSNAYANAKKVIDFIEEYNNKQLTLKDYIPKNH